MGTMKVATSEALASTVNSHSLDPGDSFEFSVDNFGALDSLIDLNEIWFDGSDATDRLVVTYTEYVTQPGNE